MEQVVVSEREDYLEKRLSRMLARERELIRRLQKLGAETALAKAELAMYKIEHEDEKSWLQAKVQRQRIALQRIAEQQASKAIQVS